MRWGWMGWKGVEGGNGKGLKLEGGYNEIEGMDVDMSP